MANSFVHSVNRDDISIDVGQLGVYTIKGAGSRISERTPICDRKVQKDYGERFDTDSLFRLLVDLRFRLC